ncbi:MAG: glycine cleavage system aminomethyltransferase GcvT [Thermoleophilia bacterium]|nr:glycine cleavage system aminomethyltransferase GcvT [Thermoleophilia bacterium]
MGATLKRTPLFERHVGLGARMVPFAGFEMPVQYEGVIPEHRAVRGDCGVFDVSHMGELHVDGPTAQAFLQAMLSNDVDRVGDGQAQYTLLTNEQGGIVDDLIVYRFAHGQFLLVVNASNREAAFAWLKDREPRGAEVRDASDEYGLLAVQGPRALGRLGLLEAPAFTHDMGEIDGIEVLISRTGYTGERGVELCCAADETPALWDAVLARGAVPCGLGARDTLRLEVCYPLHGNDIGPETDSISAGLGWACALATEFTGVDVLRRTRDEGPTRRLVPFVLEERAVPRQGMPIEGGGEVTSGTHSPMLDVGIGMGYLPSEAATPGNDIVIDVRGKPKRARVVKKPIYRRET